MQHLATNFPILKLLSIIYCTSFSTTLIFISVIIFCSQSVLACPIKEVSEESETSNHMKQFPYFESIVRAVQEAKCLRQFGGFDTSPIDSECSFTPSCLKSNETEKFKVCRNLAESTLTDISNCTNFCSHDVPRSQLCGEICSNLHSVLCNKTSIVKWERRKDVQLSPEFFCESHDTNSSHFVYLKWHLNFDNKPASNSDNHPLIFIIQEKYSTNNNQTWKTIAKTLNSIHRINIQNSSTTYIWKITAVGTNGVVSESDVVEFTPKKAQAILLPPKRVFLRKIFADKTGAVNALLGWDPPSENPCFYKIELIQTQDILENYTIVEIIEPSGYYEHLLKRLQFDTYYQLRMSSMSHNNVNVPDEESSSSVTFHFRTPTCLQLLENNFTLCSPPPPRNLKAQALTPENLTKMLLLWDPPEHTSHDNQIDTYEVEVFHAGENGNWSLLNTSFDGSSTSITVRKLSPTLDYHIRIRATSKGGRSEPAYIYYTPETKKSTKTVEIFLYAMAIIVTIFLLIACIFYARKVFNAGESRLYRNRFTLRRRGRNINRVSTNAEQCQPSLIPLQEVPCSISSRPNFGTWNAFFCKNAPKVVLLRDLHFEEIIGEGKFGVVQRATIGKTKLDRKITLQPNASTTSVSNLEPDEEMNDEELVVVAVKMLKRNDNDQLLREVTMMQILGPHPHIVAMHGVTVTPKREISMVLEYCAGGDLLSFMKLARTKIRWNAMESGSGSQADPIGIGQLGENIPVVSEVDILTYGHQISDGMEHLEKKRVVHRDLSCRNILLTGDYKEVKISDFGLSRKVYRFPHHGRKFHGKQAEKRWKAIDNMQGRSFTTKSDVWSFGIVLWEMVTMGGSPYPEVERSKLASMIHSGYKMERPENCSVELYNVMRNCWNSDPSKRPTFSELKMKIESLKEAAKPHSTINDEISAFLANLNNIGNETVATGLLEDVIAQPDFPTCTFSHTRSSLPPLKKTLLKTPNLEMEFKERERAATVSCGGRANFRGNVKANNPAKYMSTIKFKSLLGKTYRFLNTESVVDENYDPEKICERQSQSSPF